jgi:MFS family permease
MAARITTKNSIANRPRPLWQNRDYVLLWSGQTISNFGTQASQLAFPLLVLALTHSPIHAGIIGAIRLIPYVVLGLPAGAWIDRVDRKRLMISCDIIRALALGSIPLAFLFGRLTLFQLYVAALVEGSLYVFFNIAETSCLPHVVPKEQLSAALGQDQASDGAANLLGPSLGGALYSLNQLFPFLADAISYTISVISLLFVRTSFQSEKRTVAPRKLSTEIAEGLRWLWQQPLLRFVAFRNTGITFSYAGATLLVITLLQQQKASSAIIGIILAIGGVGQIAGSLLGPIIQKRFSYRQIITAIAWGYFLSWSLYLFASTPLLIGVITAALFTNRPIQTVATSTVRAMLVPDKMRGRVNSVLQIISWCAIPLGSLVTGVLLQLVGLQVTILFFSACFLILAVTTSFNPHLRNAPSWAELQKLHDIANEVRKVRSLAGTSGVSQVDTWVSFGRYLAKLPDDRHTAVQEIYAFPSTGSVAAYVRQEKWAGIDRYLIKLPDRRKDTEEVYVYQSFASIPESFDEEKWNGIDHYLLRLPDRHRTTQEVYAVKSPQVW